MEKAHMTLLEATAIAVLKGDLGAAMALVDQLNELREGMTHDEKMRAMRAAGRPHTSWSGEVYGSPEFRAFCERWGIAWDAYTVQITIHLPADGPMSVIHEHRGVDRERPVRPG